MGFCIYYGYGNTLTSFKKSNSNLPIKKQEIWVLDDYKETTFHGVLNDFGEPFFVFFFFLYKFP